MVEYLMIAAVDAETFQDTVDVNASDGRLYNFDRKWFEDNAVEIEPGRGLELKAVCATALLMALSGGVKVPYANDEPSNAEQGNLTDDMVHAVARIGFNVVREWRKKEGLLHHPPFDEAGANQQNMARTRVVNIVQQRRYPLDISNQASVFEDQLYRIVCASVLAD